MSHDANSVAPSVSEELKALLPGTLDCVHCGLCLTSCPTYRVTGRETSSPRGRIYLMRGVAEGRIDLAGTVAEEAHLCLGCRACETACPAGVEYGSLLEHTRAAVADAGLQPGFAKRIETLALRQIVPHPRRLHLLLNVMSLAQRLGLDRAVTAFLPKRLQDMHALLPVIPPRRERGRLPTHVASRAEARGRVAVFEGCLMPEMFGRVNAATVSVLSACGLDVVVPEGQGCCGALQAHAGDRGFAKGLLETNIEAFDPASVDAIVVNSAGCGAALREADRLAPGAADALAAKVRDVSEVVMQAGLPEDLDALEATVCYDDPCHLVHGQGVASPPREMLAAIPGLRMVPHADPGACCGAAGIYNLTHPEMSQAVLARKLDSLEAADPDYIATGNPGCIMQLEAGARARGMRAQVVHPIELVARALGSQR